LKKSSSTKVPHLTTLTLTWTKSDFHSQRGGDWTSLTPIGVAARTGFVYSIAVPHPSMELRRCATAYNSLRSPKLSTSVKVTFLRQLWTQRLLRVSAKLKYHTAQEWGAKIEFPGKHQFSDHLETIPCKFSCAKMAQASRLTRFAQITIFTIFRSISCLVRRSKQRKLIQTAILMTSISFRVSNSARKI